MQKKCFELEQYLLKYWETLKCETVHQRLCRMLLSVHNKFSLASLAKAEMTALAGQGKDCWLARVQNIERLLKVPTSHPRYSSKTVSRHIKNRFESFWLKGINAPKFSPDGTNHYKLRTYCQLKDDFSVEPYVVNRPGVARAVLQSPPSLIN